MIGRLMTIILRPYRAGFAAALAARIEAGAMPPCDHRDRPSCPKCAARRTALADARLVREAGGAS